MRVWRPYLAHPDDQKAPTALIRDANLAIGAFLVVALMPLLSWAIGSRNALILLPHLMALTMTLFFGAGNSRGRLGIVRDWNPLAVVLLLYFEMRWIIAGVGMPRHDFILQAWELAIFRAPISHTLASHASFLAISEILHLAYLTYYPAIALPPLFLWLSGKRREFEGTVASLVIVYILCFATYAVFPADGPRYITGPSDAPNGVLRHAVIALLDIASSRGTAFPSSHVAAAIVATGCALLYQRWVGYIVLACTLGLSVGAVYGGYHYGVDILAGAGYGGAALFIGRLSGILRYPVMRVDRFDHVKIHVMHARIDRHHRLENRRAALQKRSSEEQSD